MRSEAETSSQNHIQQENKANTTNPEREKEAVADCLHLGETADFKEKDKV